MDLQIFGGSGAGSRKRDGRGGADNNEQETHIRGVSQSQIDQLRGTRGHLGKDELTTNLIKEDYARVGIKISPEEAKEIRNALHNFTANGYINMRNALISERQGKELSDDQKKALQQYNLCIEYCNIAPTYQPKPNQTAVYRGLPAGRYDQYGEKIANLKTGDKWDVDKMPTSFSTDKGTAYTFAGAGFNEKGVIIHVPIKNLKNSPSIKGLAKISSENEVLLSDYKWKVKGKYSEFNEDNNEMVHIYLEPDA